MGDIKSSLGIYVDTHKEDEVNNIPRLKGVSLKYGTLTNTALVKYS